MRIPYIAFFLGFVLLLQNCNKVPITGRKQMNLLPESMLMDMSLTNYKKFLNKNEVVDNTPNARTVQQVGKNISQAVEKYLKNNGFADRVEDYDWEFNLVKNEAKNAWCMPGGKVVFYSGIMPITKHKGGVAVVMGHEIAHAVARHGNERMSQQLAIQMGGMALSVALAEEPEQTRKLFLAAYGIGSAVGVMLPYSRKHEAEADKMGLVFMALAGYDPHQAVKFWQRMQEQSGARPPEFLSTHPSHESRIKEIKQFMPRAMKHYKK